MPTSSDGVLTATVDSASASIDLVANFGSLIPPATTNLVANPNSEAASVFATFTNATGPTSAAQKHTGAQSTALTASTAANMSGTTPNTFPVMPSTAYVASVWLRPNATARSASLAIAWYTSAGALISTSTGGASTETASAWKQYTETASAPSTAAFAALVVSVTSPASGEIHFVDDMQLELGTTPTAFCDGSQNGCRWSGAVNNSISVRDPITALTVTRSDGLRVFGLDNLPAPGGNGLGIDHTAPLGVSVSYTAAAINARGVSVYTSTSVSATITQTTPVIWLKSLTYPALSVQLSAYSLPDWQDAISQGVFPIVGSSYPVEISDVRQAPSGTLAIPARDAGTLADVRALLASQGPYFLQTFGYGEDDVYVSVGQVTRARITYVAGDPSRRITLPLQVVARPTTVGSLVTRPGHSYADSAGTWSTYSARTGNYNAR